MQLPDVINGLFEAFGAGANFTNILVLRKHKVVRGVHWGPTAFFSTWGLWNLYYYPSLNQWVSFAGGCAIVLCNLVWLAHAWKYRNNE